MVLIYFCDFHFYLFKLFHILSKAKLTEIITSSKRVIFFFKAYIHPGVVHAHNPSYLGGRD
jgi:hypothetical protein